MPSSLHISCSFFLSLPISLFMSCPRFLKCSTYVPCHLSVCLSFYPSIYLILSVLLTFCFILYVFVIYLFPYFHTIHSKSSYLFFLCFFLSVFFKTTIRL
jgi:hypothetical protein